MKKWYVLLALMTFAVASFGVRPAFSGKVTEASLWRSLPETGVWPGETMTGTSAGRDGCLKALPVPLSSDEHFVVSDLFGDLGPRDKAAVLMVHFGTTYDDTRAQTIDAVNARMKAAFPGVEFREAWTSRIILRKLKARGVERQNPAEALIRLHEEGYTHVLVQSTNIIEGMEMKELRSEVERLSLNFKDIRIGNPLLYTPEDYSIVAGAITEAMNRAFENGQKLLVGHGTHDPATASYAMFDYMLKAEGHADYHVGTVEGYPEYGDALRLLKTRKARTVTLAPLMLVAGDHARNDIAGEWKERLEKEGYRVNLYLKGLGENPVVQELFVRHARFAAAHKAVDMKTKKAAYRAGRQ